MKKYRLQNIVNRPVPLGNGLTPKPGEIVIVELTPRMEYLIINKFYSNLGIFKEIKQKIKNEVKFKKKKVKEVKQVKSFETTEKVEHKNDYKEGVKGKFVKDTNIINKI